MLNTLFANILLFLSLFYTSALADPTASPPALAIRQTTTTTTTGTTDMCAMYGRTANVSVVGTNSTYRAAFLGVSKTGGLYDQRMFAAAMAALPAMTMDQALNAQCGNRTAIALAGAEANFTQGIVLEIQNAKMLDFKPGPEILVLVAACMIVLGGVWSFQP